MRSHISGDPGRPSVDPRDGTADQFDSDTARSGNAKALLACDAWYEVQAWRQLESKAFSHFLLSKTVQLQPALSPTLILVLDEANLLFLSEEREHKVADNCAVQIIETKSFE